MPSEINNSPASARDARGRSTPLVSRASGPAGCAVTWSLTTDHRLVAPRSRRRFATQRNQRRMKSAFIPSGIHSSDLVQFLRREGFDVAPWRLRYAAQQGHVPAPFKTSSGDHAWRQSDLPAITRYFKNPRRPGRPRVAK
jgi:hypothetical protein